MSRSRRGDAVNSLILARVVWLEILRRKDLYVLGLLLAAALAALLSTDTFGAEGAARYLVDTGATLAWAASLILTLSAAARQLPADENRGTVLAILAKPVSRASVVIGKWLGVWTAGAAAAALFYVVTLSAAALRGGGVDGRTLTQALLLHAAALSVATALAIALSTRLTLGAALTIAWLVVLHSWFFASRIPELSGGAGAVRGAILLAAYFATPQWTLFDLRLRLAHGWGPAPAAAVSVALVYAAGWTVLLLGLAWLGYRRRYFKRGGA